MGASPLATIDDALIDRVRDRIVEACDPDALYLFGSAARGQTQKGSDLDLLVVTPLPDGVTNRDKSRELHALFRGWKLPLDIIVRTPDQFQRGTRLPGFIERTVERDGIMLHRKNNADES
jgi:predicted nucleotidyltransferase